MTQTYPAPDFFTALTQKPSRALWWAIALYVLVYRIITPPVNAMVMDTGAALIFTRGISNALYQLTLFFPILFMRRVGIFHPLAFPALYDAAFSVVFDPGHIFLPLLAANRQFLATSTSYSVFLWGMGGAQYANLNIKLDIICSIFLAFSYLGFMALKSKGPVRINYRRQIDRYIPAASACYLIAAILIGFVFIMARGGLEQQILSFYKGRHETLSGYGAIFAWVKTSVVALMLWVAAAPGRRLPWQFALLALCLMPIYWLVDGSRSSLVILLLSIIVIYSLKTRAIPKKALVIAGMFAFVIFGMLGLLRRDYHATQVNFSVFSGAGLLEAVQASQSETNKRGAEEGDIAVIKAMDHMGELAGRSYLSVLALPIPRAFWPDKPKNIFIYVNWVAFLGKPIDTFAPDTWGIPIKPATEAYWNFGFLGLIFVGALVGLGQRLIFNALRNNPASVPLVVIYVESLLYLNGGSRWAFYFMQNCATLLLILILAEILRRHARQRVAPLLPLRA
ncbi:hypothetical protein [Sphingobium yanoikuyae]|jgi:hypothetical protein|uniref:Oligosaccharide repeat unit polymerase n=1 Tax=Sphingobium yanoikuyae TaxID=13690 RepID=A0A430BDG8_SPHYA|nr:hypothetical protein [Sphingobium yanoikuyae]RSU46760.1 hypothetical protein DAH51_25435 [Sphingobium yanoikuyae]